MAKKNDFRKQNLPTAKTNQKTKEIIKVNNGVFVYTRSLTLNELANELKLNVSEVIKFLFVQQKKMVTINQNLDDETIGLICLEYGYDFKKEKIVSEENFEELEIVDKPEDLVSRPAVVTIMGHVDHGKTTLIDAIRSSNVVGSEVGGISQAIGAYQKEVKGQKITFLDTPGHEAFTAMRSRGAAVTDIVVLIVAADDGIMPQTIEAISHAKAAEVPIIVAINKIDKEGANIDRIKSDLMNHDIIAEEYGGSNIFCEISAKKKIGIDELLESIILVAEMLELKANNNRFAIGSVIEAVLDKGEGPKATLLVQNGTLNHQDYIVVGSAYGKIRRMTNEHKKTLKTAGPSSPVSIIGLSEVPNAGDSFMAFSNEKQAKDIAMKRKLLKDIQSKSASSSITSLEDLYGKIEEGVMQTINVIIKADTTGSAEAIKSSIEKLSNEQVNIKTIHSSAGSINEGDIMLASTSGAIIIGFNIRPSAIIRAKAEFEKVDIRLYRIIYDITNDLINAMNGMLKKEIVEKVTGQAEVRNVIFISRIGNVAGCQVISGLIKSHSLVRLLRNDVVIYEGKIMGLKRFKDECKEVKEGFECGITIENYNDVKEGDIIEGYEMVEKE